MRRCTQMGTHMKKTIFEEQAAQGLMKWRNAAKEKSRHTSGNTTPTSGVSPSSSPAHLLNKFKGRSEDPQSAPTSPMRGEQELGDMYPPVVEQPRRHHRLDRRSVSSNAIHADSEIADSDFSFQQ
jgi:mlo protein